MQSRRTVCVRYNEFEGSVLFEKDDVQRSHACCKGPAVPLRTEAKISIDLLEMTASKWSR